MKERQCKCRVTKQGNARAKEARAQEVPRLRLTLKYGHTTEGTGIGQHIWTETGLWDRENTAERSPGRRLRKKNGNEQPARSLKDNLKRAAQDHNNSLATGQCGQYKKRGSASGSRSTQKHKTHDAGRSLFGVQQKTSGGISSLLEIRHFFACAQQTGGGAIARSAKFSPWSSTRWTQGRR